MLLIKKNLIWGMKRIPYFLIFCSLSLIFSCNKDEELADLPEPVVIQPELPEIPFDYATLNYPAHFQVYVLEFLQGSNLISNPITNEGATLGRVLFYDKKLSINNEVSCASCHFQEHGFSDPKQQSEGFAGGLTRRNSMPLANTIYSRNFFWDLRTARLRDQVLQPIEDSLEMGSNLEDLVVELANTEYYPELFKAAFDSDSISSDLISNALTQFINSMTAYSSKYDEGIDTDFANFTEQELLGKSLFFESGLNCNQCHTNTIFTNTAARNNGIAGYESDLGQMEVSGEERDKFEFKIPTLRNIGLTAPYMHDGRFETLEEVIEHYNSGIQPFDNLDDRLTTTGVLGGPPRQMNLNEEEKAALVSFLHTLTDEVLVTHEKYSDPFLK